MRQMIIPGSGDSRKNSQGDPQGGLLSREMNQKQQQSQQQRGGFGLSVRESRQAKQQDDRQATMLLERALKKKRSSAYMNQIRMLDAGEDLLTQESINTLIQEIQDNLGPLDMELAHPVGIIAKCYLGAPFEVHTLSYANNIIEHYKEGYSLPGGMEKYRSIACSGSYEFIEVYTSYACAVRSNGMVTLIEN